MDWPTWSDIAPMLATVVGLLVALLAGSWALGRMFRPWMRIEARSAADTVNAEVKALADKLSTNDFPHIEAKIESVEARIGERLDRMEARILEAVRGRPDTPSQSDSPSD